MKKTVEKKDNTNGNLVPECELTRKSSWLQECVAGGYSLRVARGTRVEVVLNPQSFVYALLLAFARLWHHVNAGKYYMHDPWNKYRLLGAQADVLPVNHPQLVA